MAIAVSRVSAVSEMAASASMRTRWSSPRRLAQPASSAAMRSRMRGRTLSSTAHTRQTVESCPPENKTSALSGLLATFLPARGLASPLCDQLVYQADALGYKLPDDCLRAARRSRRRQQMNFTVLDLGKQHLVCPQTERVSKGGRYDDPTAGSQAYLYGLRLIRHAELLHVSSQSAPRIARLSRSIW